MLWFIGAIAIVLIIYRQANDIEVLEYKLKNEEESTNFYANLDNWTHEGWDQLGSRDVIKGDHIDKVRVKDFNNKLMCVWVGGGKAKQTQQKR